jgi:hypothetical protein
MTTKETISYLEAAIAKIEKKDEDGMEAILLRKALAYHKKPTVGRFKVLRGKHCEGYSVTKGSEGPVVTVNRYRKNDIVDSKSDLSVFNQPGARKYEQLHAVTSVTQEELEDTPHPVKDTELTPQESKDYETLNALTVPELEEYAVTEEVDISGLRKKDEIIRAILKELSVRV